MMPTARKVRRHELRNSSRKLGSNREKNISATPNIRLVTGSNRKQPEGFQERSPDGYQKSSVAIRGADVTSSAMSDSVPTTSIIFGNASLLLRTMLSLHSVDDNLVVDAALPSSIGRRVDTRWRTGAS
jgi:hypothetical protein